MEENNQTQSKKTNISIPVAIITAGFIIALGIAASNYVKKSPKTAAIIQPEQKISQATIITYSDFQCPYCARFHETMKQILENYPETKWVYKHFPLDSIHAQARSAAEASECAREQDKFWEFADGLFANQQNLSQDFYEILAQDMGLKTEQFNACLAQRKYQDRVDQDMQEGIAKGVNGTPASFINDELVSGAQPYEAVEAVIKKALNK